jgi:hypothetical protein
MARWIELAAASAPLIGFTDAMRYRLSAYGLLHEIMA